MRSWSVAVLCLLVSIPASAQRAAVDPELQRAVEQAVAGFQGRVGVYVRHLPTGRIAALNSNALFPTASLVKVPILAATFDAIEQGRLEWRQELVYRDSLLYEGEDILGSFRDGAVIPLSQVAMLMITTSDNTAALWLQQLCGTGTAVNGWLAKHGFGSTRVNARTPGRRSAWQLYGWGQTTPREMADLFVMIREGRAVSPAASDEMYRMLTRIYWNDEALSQLPPWVQAASKQGAVSDARSEVVIVNAPSGDYVFAVMTDDQEDEGWEYDNAGFELIRRMSALLWNRFEPDHPYEPPDDPRYR
jgi:beta-lactamase class A